MAYGISSAVWGVRVRLNWSARTAGTAKSVNMWCDCSRSSELGYATPGSYARPCSMQQPKEMWLLEVSMGHEVGHSQDTRSSRRAQRVRSCSKCRPAGPSGNPHLAHIAISTYRAFVVVAGAQGCSGQQAQSKSLPCLTWDLDHRGLSEPNPSRGGETSEVYG